MEASRCARRRLILADLEDAVGVLDPIAGAPPGNKGSSQGGVVEVDRDRVVQRAAQTCWRHRPTIGPAIGIEPRLYRIEAISEAPRRYANPDPYVQIQSDDSAVRIRPRQSTVSGQAAVNHLFDPKH